MVRVAAGASGAVIPYSHFKPQESYNFEFSWLALSMRIPPPLPGRFAWLRRAFLGQWSKADKLIAAKDSKLHDE